MAVLVDKCPCWTCEQADRCEACVPPRLATEIIDSMPQRDSDINAWEAEREAERDKKKQDKKVKKRCRKVDDDVPPDKKSKNDVNLTDQNKFEISGIVEEKIVGKKKSLQYLVEWKECWMKS